MGFNTESANQLPPLPLVRSPLENFDSVGFNTESANQLPPLPQRGRGAGGEGAPRLPSGPPAVPPQGEEVGEGERTNAGHPSRNGRTGLVRA